MTALLMFGGFALLLILGVPIALSLGVSTMAAIAGSPDITVSINTVAQRIFGGLDSTSIMAIAFFVLSGNLMTKGGISRRICEFARSIIGGVRGGMALTLVLACAFFAALSGSAPATVVAIGTMLYGDMVRMGYPGDRTAGLLVVSGGLGPIIPPSIIMVVYATITGASVGDMFKSGMGIGGLLMEGIGDTLRVSLTDEPENEVYAGYDILRAAGYAVAGPEIISCPTCGRTQYPMIEIANEVEARLRDEGFKKPLKIAIMGCVVNGPGEASDADIGIAGGKDEALLFIRGEKIRMLKGDIVGQLLEEIHKM